MDEKKWKDPSPWVPMTSTIGLKILGKLCEEAGELVAAADRHMYVGPRTPHTIHDLEDEIADVRAGIELAVEHFHIDMERIKVLVRSYQGDGSELVIQTGKLIAAISRCIIQGVDEAHPETKRPNRDWLQEEMAHTFASCIAVKVRWQLNADQIDLRVEFKKKHLRRWHQMLDHNPGEKQP